MNNGPVIPSFADIERIVLDCIERLKKNDYTLFKLNCHETCVAHKLGEYLQQAFGSVWNVDLEYSRGNGPERYSEIKRPDGRKPGRIDLNVHQRKSTNNLLVIEMKKKRNLTIRTNDEERLKALTSQFGQWKYITGLALSFTTCTEQPDMQLKWFQNGQEKLE